MNADVSFNFVSQMAHLFCAAFLTLAVAEKTPTSLRAFVWGAIALAAVKEFWWDLTYETPDAAGSGGIMGSIEDFAFYMAGIVLALGVHVL